MTNLPCQECRGKCCTFPAFSPIEYAKVKAKYRIKESASEMILPGMVIIHEEDGTCPFLDDGKCSIYDDRPKVCRDYGINPKMPCAYLYPEKAEASAENLIQRIKLTPNRAERRRMKVKK